MTFSPDGTRLLVATGTGVLDLFDVNRCTGELSNWVQISPPTVRGPDNWYGCSFSPDGTKVYADELDLPYNSHLYQWDLNAPNIAASKTLIYADTTTDTYWGQHQLGPDGRIYITTASPDSASLSNFYLGVINEPDSLGTACQFSRYGLYLQGLRTSFNLPNLPNYSLGSLFAQTAEAGPPLLLICPGSSVQLGVPDTSGGAVTFAWMGPHLNDSSAAQPLAKPDSTTWYYLTVTDTAYGAPCGVTMDSILIRVAGPSEIPYVILGNDTLLCPSDSLILGDAAVAGWQYHWSGGGFILSPDSATTILSGAGAYALTVVNPLGTGACFTSLDSVQVSEYQSPMPANPAGSDVLICNGDSAVLGATGTNWHYDWSSAVGGLSDMHTAQPLAWPSSSTMYTLHAYDTAFAGYCARVIDTVIVTVEQPFTHASPEDVTFCPGECFTMGVPSASADYQYLWSPVTGLENPNQSMSKAQPSATTIYNLSITNPALQSAHCREKQFTVLAIADACNHQSFIAVNGDAIAERLDLGDHAGRVSLRVHDVAGRLVFADDDYQNDWSATGLAHGMYVYRVTVEGDCASSFTGKIVVVR